MRLLKTHLLSLLLTYGLLFNIERLDLGQSNLLNIQSFVYVLALLVTFSILLIPAFSHQRVTLAIGFTLVLYSICNLLIFVQRPIIGGIYTYVTITEVALLALVAFVSQRLAQSLEEFQTGLEALTLALGGRHLDTISRAGNEIRRELTRSRHYHRPLSLIVVEPKLKSFGISLPTIIEEMQQAIATRFARVKLAQTMRQQLRLMDLVLEEDEHQDHFIILCPEADEMGTAVLVERIEAVMNQAGIEVQCSTATFPDEALTFEGLLNQAKDKLSPRDSKNN
jgi:hypothetical protein